MKKFWAKLCCLFYNAFTQIKQAAPFVLISFFISFNYYILKISKDTLIITSSVNGAETIPFIKLFILTPVALILTFIFSWVSVKFGTQKAFYIFMCFFIGYISLFTLVLYPMGTRIELDKVADFLLKTLPSGMRGFSFMIRKWHFSTFYVICDMWTPIMLNMCFWGFKNSITKQADAAKLYPIIRIGLNSSGIISGYLGLYICSIPYSPSFILGLSAWDQAFIKSILIVMLFAFLTLIMFFHLSSKNRIERCNEEKKKANIKDQIDILSNSKGILYLATTTFSIGFILNAIDILWKAKSRQAFPDPISFSQYMHQVHIATGIIAMSSSLLMCSNTIKKLGLLTNALATPIVSAITGVGFFGAMFIPKISSWFGSTYFINTLPLVLWFGMLNSALVRAAKCSFFDTSKDICLIRMNSKERIVGKSVVDGAAFKMGKSGASVMFTVMLTIMSSLDNCAPIVSMLVVFVTYKWIDATVKIKKWLDKERPVSN